MQPQILFSILILLLTIEVSSFQLFSSFSPSEGEHSVKNNEKIYGEEEHSQKKREAAVFSIKGQSKTLKRTGENIKGKRRGLVEGKKIVLRVARKSSKAKKEYDNDGSSSSSKDSSSKDSSSSKGSSSHKDSSSGHSSESKESHSSKDSSLKPCSPNEDSSSVNEKPSNSKSLDTVSTSEASPSHIEESSTFDDLSSVTEQSSTFDDLSSVTEESSTFDDLSSVTEESSTFEDLSSVTEESSTFDDLSSVTEESSTFEDLSSVNEESSTISESCASVCSGFGWTNYNGNCYKVIEGLMNQTQAVVACTAEDPQAQLVSIWDEAENRLISQIITRPLARSLQTYNLASPIFNTFWIGLRRVLVGNRYQSTWTNGSAAIFGNVPEITTAASRNTSPWAAGQPSGTNKYTDPTGAKEECVHMLNAEGRWNDARCEIQMTGAICKKSNF